MGSLNTKIACRANTSAFFRLMNGTMQKNRVEAAGRGFYFSERVSSRACPHLCVSRIPCSVRLGMNPLALQDILARLEKWKFPEALDGVVGIASGGVVPAALVAQHLGLGLKVLAVNYRDESNEPRFAEPRVLAPPPDLGCWRRVLLVDDVYVSGKSWNVARTLIPSDVEVLPFVLKGNVEFALIRDIEGCVHWPWQ